MRAIYESSVKLYINMVVYFTINIVHRLCLMASMWKEPLWIDVNNYRFCRLLLENIICKHYGPTRIALIMAIRSNLVFQLQAACRALTMTCQFNDVYTFVNHRHCYQVVSHLFNE